MHKVITGSSNFVRGSANNNTGQTMCLYYAGETTKNKADMFTFMASNRNSSTRHDFCTCGHVW